jgi:ABC-2 type transport system permease protein
MLGHEQHIRHWIVVLVLTVVGWAFTLFALRRYRARVPYWV